MKNNNLGFGIGDRLYNSICEDCRNNLYNIGLAAVKTCNRSITIDIDEYSGDFIVEIFANDMHSYCWTFDTLYECIALLTGINAINEFNNEMIDYI